MICKNCAKELDEDSNYCVQCGTKTEFSSANRLQSENLFQDGFFVCGFAFFLFHVLIIVWQSSVQDWYEYKALNIVVNILSLSFPLLLAYYAKGKSRSILLLLGALSVAYVLYRIIIG